VLQEQEANDDAQDTQHTWGPRCEKAIDRRHNISPVNALRSLHATRDHGLSGRFSWRIFLDWIKAPHRWDRLQPPKSLDALIRRVIHLWGGHMTERVDPKGLSDAVALEEQIADLKQTVALLRAELADMREQRDKWQSRAERVSLTAPC
jgi:hypothetical protein